MPALHWSTVYLIDSAIGMCHCNPNMWHHQMPHIKIKDALKLLITCKCPFVNEAFVTVMCILFVSYIDSVIDRTAFNSLRHGDMDMDLWNNLHWFKPLTVSYLVQSHFLNQCRLGRTEKAQRQSIQMCQWNYRNSLHWRWLDKTPSQFGLPGTTAEEK